MKVEVTPASDPEKLVENLRERFEEVKMGEKIAVETEEPEKLGRIPGIKSYKVRGEEREGLGGQPVDEKAYAKIKTKRDLAEAFLATVSGYDLVVVECSREWDLKLLKRYNPSIREVSEPSDIFEIDKALNLEGFEGLGIEIDDEEVELVYSKVVS